MPKGGNKRRVRRRIAARITVAQDLTLRRAARARGIDESAVIRALIDAEGERLMADRGNLIHEVAA